MSLNKVLNRPMFRQKALKKGHLKPIKARTGRSIVGPMQPPVPMVIPQAGQGVTIGPAYNRGLALRAQPTFAERMTSRARALGRGIFNIPAIGGFYAGDKVAQAMGVNDPIGRTAAGLGGSYLATRAMPTLAGIGMLPSAMVLGTAYGLKNRYDAGVKEYNRIKNMTPEEREAHRQKSMQFGMSYLDDDQFNEQFGSFTPKLDEIVKQDTSQKKLKRGVKRGQTEKNVDVATQPDNTTEIGKSNVIDTSKIAENAMPSAEQFQRQDILPEDPDKVELANLDEQTDKKEEKGKGDGGDAANKDTINADSPFKAQLDLARQIAKEMRQGKTSNANLVFLSNLASGLLTGTTKRSGIGGALEVFGAALGPAVNNMVMVKMKEDEIEQNLLGRALEFSTDFLKAQNQAFEMPDTSEVGVIQYTNEAGRIVNVPGRMLKDGTLQRATGTADANGLYQYQTVDPNLNFIANKDMNKETLDIAKSIAGKYAAVNLINRSLGIIQSGGAQAGVTGAIGLYGGRLSEALGDVLSFAKIGGDSKAELKAAGQAMFNIEQKKVANALVAAGEFENSNDALKYLNSRAGLGNFQKNYNDSIRNAKRRLKDGSTLDYERLAINETVLVYKLANSLKAKDRLTQKDIEMAKGLVKVFPLLRGETNVIASLTATAETILDDIKQQERLYERAGGSSQYLLNERKAYGLLPDEMTVDNMTDFESKEFKNLQKKIEEMTEEDFLKIFPPEFFK